MAIDREKIQAAAQKFVDKKKYDKAIAELLKIVQEDPNDARTLLKIGDLYLKVPDIPSAISTYERVGKFYAHQGFALKAIAVYKQIREIIAKQAPQYEERYSHITPILADLFQQLGLASDALAALDEHAGRLMRQGKDAEALDVLRRIVELDPTNPLPHLRLAEALSKLKDAEGAVQEFGDAASLLVKLGRRDDAIKVFERLLHLKPDVRFAHECAELYLDRGMGQDGMLALAKLQLCFQADPKNLDTLALLARAFGAIGQANKGIEVQKEMARLAKEQGKFDLFRQLIDKLMRVAPNDEQVRAMSRNSQQMPALGPQSVSAVSSQSVAEPVIREASQTSRPEPSYASVDSQDFVDDAEIEEVEPSVASRRSALRGAPQPPPEDNHETVRYNPRQHDLDALAAGHTNVERPRAAASEPPPSEPDLQIDDEAIELDDAGSSDDDEEIREAVAQALADAASFRRVKLFAKALESLATGLELDPMSREVHEAMRDILVDTGDYEEAAGHNVVIAGMQLEAGEVEAAVHGLYDALSLMPHMKQAEEMLESLGYELPIYGEPPGEEVKLSGAATAAPPPMESEPAPVEQAEEAEEAVDPPPHVPRFATEPPLPAYPLHEGDESGATVPPPEFRATEAPAAMGAMDGETGEHDFGVEDAPLPSFPLPVESDRDVDVVHARTSRPPAGDTPAHGVDELAHTGSAPPAAQVPSAELEDVLEEADFFASRGLFDDARTIITEQLERHPGHMLLVERLAELDAQEEVARETSGPREPPRAPPSLDRSFDIAASLDAIENLDTSGGMGAGGFQAASEQIDVEEVFAAFKEGVAKQVSVDDSQSHYDLGVAYKEMGLLDDAIHEFEIAARDAKRDCVCRSMVGYIQLDRGKVPEAVEAFQKGLAAAIKTTEQEMVLCYEIGSGFETMGKTKDALAFFQRVQKVDPSYREVAGRIRRLSGKPAPKAAPKPAAAEDDFDRAFDDMLGDGTNPGVDGPSPGK